MKRCVVETANVCKSEFIRVDLMAERDAEIDKLIKCCKRSLITDLEAIQAILDITKRYEAKNWEVKFNG